MATVKKETKKAEASKKAVAPKKETIEKTVSNKSEEDAKENVSDIVFVGTESNDWKLMCKAFSKKEGWMKSTKALNLGGNEVLVQVTTQQRNQDGSYAISEALTTVKGNLYESDKEKGIFVIGN